MLEALRGLSTDSEGSMTILFPAGKSGMINEFRDRILNTGAIKALGEYYHQTGNCRYVIHITL